MKQAQTSFAYRKPAATERLYQKSPIILSKPNRKTVVFEGLPV
jgi:hypothetical protein